MASLSSSSTIAFSLLILLFVTNATAATNLSPNFYSKSCRLALNRIKTAVSIAVFNDRRIGASLLRLHFHDCFVNGCDASILLDDTPSLIGEKTAGPNFNSVRGYELIDFIKFQLESLCPGVVSCADIVAVAARDSVVALGGPSWNVQLGRKDSITASLTAANSDLPGPSSDLNSLVSAFARKGFTAKEMVVLSGAHTIGKARCQFFRSNDASINFGFASWVRANCFGNDNRLIAFDGSTNTFDNTYFKDLKNNKGFLHSDQELYKGGRGPADFLVNTYSTNTTAFFSDFANAMLKMGNLSPLPGSTGPVRTSCRKIKRF